MKRVTRCAAPTNRSIPQGFGDRIAWWMISTMGLRDGKDAPVPDLPPGAGRCDLHGIGHAPIVFILHFVSFLFALMAVIAFLCSARPELAGPAQTGHTSAIAVGAALGIVGLSSFSVGRLVARRTRYHVWVQYEMKPVNRETVFALRCAIDHVKGRLDRRWTPDQVWIVGPQFTAAAVKDAHRNKIRCFARSHGVTREV